MLVVTSLVAGHVSAFATGQCDEDSIKAVLTAGTPEADDLEESA